MNETSTILLGTLPTPGNFVSIFKVGFVLVWFLVWLLFCQWVDKDTRYVKVMPRGLWNGVVLGGGALGMAAWLFLPLEGGLFYEGWAIWLLMALGSAGLYVGLRNKHVDPVARVFTPRHIASVLGGLGGKKKSKGAGAVERIKITGADGKHLAVPDDPVDMGPYEALQILLFDALWRRVTDAEMHVKSDAIRLAYKVDGVVNDRSELLTPQQGSGAISLLRTLAGMDTEEHRKPQKGTVFGVLVGGDGTSTQIDVMTSGSTAGERLALRIVASEQRMRTNELGLTEKQLELLDEIIKRPGGLIVVAGPKGSGVTTTLYAALRHHDAFMQNLHTLERAPLMELENVTQNVFDPTRADMTFARQLQSVLRREPDVVVVGDCSDRETANHAARGASTGKKIYLGLSARDSFEALKKLVNLVNDSDLVADTLQAILTQRLVRKLCVACRQPYKPDRSLLRKANLPAEKIGVFYRPPEEVQVDKRGNPIICPNCQGTGHFGRTGIFELLVVDDAMRDMIRTGQPTNAIKSQSRKRGMLYLQENGLQKVIDGTSSMNEIIRCLRNDGSSSARAAAKRRPKQPASGK